MDHREGRHSGEDVERMKVKAVGEEVSREEGFRGEEKGRKDDEE